MNDEMKAYVITYKSNRTGEKVQTIVWANSVKDARERFRDCDERRMAERIESVKRDS